jgi:predicted extracellular nuclease
MKKEGLLNINIFALTSTLAFTSHAVVVINEIDYDNPGTDEAEFIELFNSGTSTISLDNYFLDLINGSTSSAYRSIDLSGFSIAANDYFVVCGGSASTVANCSYNFTTTNGWIQNGSPDAVALYENNSLIDSLSYEGVLVPFTEGNTLSISDNNSEILSISRVINGLDSNDNALDFQLGCITPGSPNIAGSGDCSTPLNPVPVPAAIWLFGAGLIGLVGVARKR